MIKVGIWGASGYGGGELMRWLAQHPNARLDTVTSKTYAREPVRSAFAGLAELDLVFADEDTNAFSECDVVFLAGNDEQSMCAAVSLIEDGVKVVDLSAAFRFKEKAEYERWYGHSHRSPHLLSEAVYGLPEIHKEEIKKGTLIGNPGCFVTAAVLALAPALHHRIIKPAPIIVDGVSGVSGAGRSKFGLDYHFAEMNENAWAYKIAGDHRHIGEMEQELSAIARESIAVGFAPHVVPMTRGILVTCHALMNLELSKSDALELYKSFYSKEPFTTVVDDLPTSKHTTGSNHCHIGLEVDFRTGRLVVISALDNLGKGMAGQAIQNMNLMFGLEETAGLKGASLWP